MRSAVRAHPRGPGPAPAFLSPPRNCLWVCSGLAAQVCGLPGERLVQLSLGRAFEDPRDFGEQVGPAVGERAEFGHRGGLLVLGQLAPPGVMPCRAGELCDEETIGIGTGTIVVHLARIEHDYVKNYLNSRNSLLL